jgi:hypothetical protein
MCGDLLAAGEGTRHGELVRVAFSLGVYIQPGFLDQTEIVQALTRTVEVVCEARRHVDELRTMREMVEAGAQKPHELGHIARKSGQRHLSVVPGGTVGNAALKAPEPPGDAPETDGPLFEGVRDNGTVPCTEHNIRELLRFYGVRLAFNEMTKESELDIPKAILGQGNLRRGTKLAAIRNLARRHRISAEQALKDQLLIIEDQNAYHPVRDWIQSKPWDGVDRFETLWGTVVVREQHAAKKGPTLVSLAEARANRTPIVWAMPADERPFALRALRADAGPVLRWIASRPAAEQPLHALQQREPVGPQRRVVGHHHHRIEERVHRVAQHRQRLQSLGVVARG